jgi:ribosomal protein S18 acetylase RimI-like enzyme
LKNETLNQVQVTELKTLILTIILFFMPEQEINISKVTVNEVEKLRHISIQTFTETFSEENTESDMQKYILENLNSEKLNKELLTNGSEFYFIKVNLQIIGYLKLNSKNAQTEVQTDDSIEIERIYIIKEFHGKQYGKLLLQKAIGIALEYHCNYIWLGVWEQNFKAISFYKKNGFNQFDQHVFKLGEDEQIDLLMKLELI